jgi:hypothetical protein
MGPPGSGALVASLGSRIPSLFRHEREQLVQAVAEGRIGLGETVAVTVQLNGLSEMDARRLCLPVASANREPL